MRVNCPKWAAIEFLPETDEDSLEEVLSWRVPGDVVGQEAEVAFHGHRGIVTHLFVVHLSWYLMTYVSILKGVAI